MLHPTANVERLHILRKDGGRGLIEVETVFKIVAPLSEEQRRATSKAGA